MAELFNIIKISVGADKLTARVQVNPGMPVRTCEDIEATARVYYLAPAIAMHTCLGDAGEHFQDCMSDTEVAHLLEHLTVEIMNETGLAGDIVSGRTHAVPGDDRLFDIDLSCPDDALTVGSLSSATFMMDWAFLYGDQPAPDFPGTVAALRHLMLKLRGEDEETGRHAPDPQMLDAAYEEGQARAAMNEMGASVLFGGAAADGVEYSDSETGASDDPGATMMMPPING